MWFVVNTARIEAAEIGARLDEGGDATGETIAFGMAFAELGGQQVGEFDLADFTLDFVVGHFRFEVVLKTIFAEELNKEFLGEVSVGGARSLFDEQAGAA